jgi:uncharacterized protein YqcC (DUF446 family)
MPPDSQVVLSQIAKIEFEMRRVGLWQAEPLQPEQYQFSEAFAMDTMAFPQWLQFIFIPRVEDSAAGGKFPSSSQVAIQAMREFDGLPEAPRLVTLLSEFDALFQHSGD